MFTEDIEPSILLLTHKKHWFSLFWSLKPVFLFTETDPPPFCKVPAQCLCSEARGWTVTAEWHENWVQVTAGGNSTHRSTSTPADPQKSQSPAATSTRKTPKTIKPLPLPGGFVPGMGEGSWEGNIVLPSSTHHRPLGVPWLKAWRWGRRECFRRLTHHIQAPSRHPSWAPDGRAGLHSWWAR